MEEDTRHTACLLIAEAETWRFSMPSLSPSAPIWKSPSVYVPLFEL